jgi:diguanylate cyclase (GGDEF)-like protein
MRLNKLKKIKRILAYWFFPATNSEIDREINENNTKNLHNICLIVSMIQVCSLIFFTILNLNNLTGSDFITSAVHVFLSVVLCVFAFALTGYMMRNRKSKLNGDIATNIVIIVLMALLLLWGEMVSTKHYISNQQMMTFFTVELCAAIFVKLRPLVSISLITITSAHYYIYLNFFVKPGMINLYNYAMFFALLIASSVYSYRYTVNNIRQRNKIELLNNNLRIIANHDSMTRLNNRYSLNHRMNEYTEKDICLAMLDINKFKAINDTYGHPFGDEVLKLVADKMLEIFNSENIYRYGGDEFLIVEDGNNIEKFKKKFKRLNKNLQNSRIEDENISLQCCFGCVKGNVNDPPQFAELIAEADKKLYEEKQRNI